MKMKKGVLVCLFLIFIFPTSNALSSDFLWAYLFSSHSKSISGETDYVMLATVGVDSDSVAVTLDFPDRGTQIRLDPWGPYVWDPTYYEYGKVIYNPPPGDWYKTSYQFLVDDGSSSPLFSHATNNIFPMDFVEADISAGKHPTITWEPVDFADRYNIRFFDTVTGERLFEEFIDENGSTSYSYQYLGNLFEEHEKLRIRITARDQDNGQIVNWSHVSYEHSANQEPIPDIKASGSDGPLEIAPGDALSVTIELDPGIYAGYPADWWCVADAPFGWYYYDAGTENWLKGFHVSYQGPLGEVSPPLEILNTSDLPIGNYTFYFGVDGWRNGRLDEEYLYYDSVDVNITP